MRKKHSAQSMALSKRLQNAQLYYKSRQSTYLWKTDLRAGTLTNIVKYHKNKNTQQTFKEQF